MEGKIARIALVTKTGEKVDTGFEQTSLVLVYEVSPLGAKEVAVHHFSNPAFVVAESKGPGGGGGCGGGKKSGQCGTEKKSGGCGGDKKKDPVLIKAEIDARVNVLADVSVLFTQKSLNAYSALALNACKIFSVKVDKEEAIGDLVARIQEMLLWDPPLWLKRAMLKSSDETTEEALAVSQ